ncbi:MAG: hypothetical protein ACLFP2_02070 [Candidatus Woesearchaeota archaeon]
METSDTFIDSILKEDDKPKRRKGLIIMIILYIIVAAIISHVFFRDFGVYAHIKNSGSDPIKRCNLLNETEQISCHQKYIQNTTKTSLCRKVHASLKDTCYTQVAINTGNKEACTYITDINSRVACKQI